MPPFHLEVARKCNMQVEPTTQTAAEHAVGGVQKRGNDELDIVPNELSVTFPSRGVPCPLPPSRIVTPPSGASHPLPLGTVGWGSWAHMYSGLVLLGCCEWSRSGVARLWPALALQDSYPCVHKHLQKAFFLQTKLSTDIGFFMAAFSESCCIHTRSVFL